MNKGLVSRHSETSSLGARQGPEAGNYWGNVEPTHTPWTYSPGLPAPSEVLGASSTASQRQDLAACVINCLCFHTKGVTRHNGAVGGEGSGLQGEAPLPPSSPGCAWEGASVLSSKKRYLSKRKLYSSES